MQKRVILGLFYVNLFLIGVFWWLSSSSLFLSGGATLLIALGRLTGLLAEFLILTELVLISRIPFIEKAYGFDNLNKLHRYIGYSLLATIASHPLLLAIGYARINSISPVDQFSTFLFHWENVTFAFIGLVIFIAIASISLPIIRKKMQYESWHFLHLFMYVAVGLSLGHQVETGDVSYGIAFFYWFLLNFLVFGSLLTYRFIHPFIIFSRHLFYVEKVVAETHNVYSVYITGKNMDQFLFEAGQYIHVSFLAKGLWQPHPFSISLAPNGTHVRISVKALGDYTQRIKNLLPKTRVIIEGPFGRFTEKAAVHDKYLLIAGGIGITPIYALAESLSRQKKDFILLYGNKTPEDIVFKKELERVSHRSYHFLSETSYEGYEQGHIDGEKIKKLVPDLQERDVYLCGPSAMTNGIVKTLLELGIRHSHIHYEKFSY